jgi:hypothetical protein
MNQFFSLKRFSLLVAKHWADNKRRYVLSVLAFIGLLITWFFFTILTLLDEPMGKQVQTATYFFVLFAFGTFYASQYFSDLGSRPKGINFLLVPASAFEKILCSVLFTVVFFFVVFTATFYLVDFLMVAIAQTFPNHVSSAKPAVANVFDIISLPFNKDTVLNFLLFYFSVQSAFLLGSVYFEKYSFIKTIICGFAGGFIVFCFMFFFNEHLFNGGSYHRGFLTSYRIPVDGVHDRVVQIPAWIGAIFRVLVLYGMAPFLWIVTYFRLKEKQV